MLRRLQIKFICVNMAIVLTMLCVILGLVLGFTQRGMERENVRMMETIAMTPFHLHTPGDQQEGVRLPYFVLDIGDDGALRAAGGSYYDLSDETFLQELADTVFASQQQNGVISEYNLRFCRVVTPVKQCLVFSDISSEISTMKGLLQTCLLVLVLALLVFFVISVCLARWAVEPVAKAWKQQRQFVADASHELKTPLTVILANAEMLQTSENDPDSQAQFSHSILVMSQQMRGLVENLLELARADNGMQKENRSLVNFSQLAESAMLPFEPLCFEKGLRLEGQIEAGVTLYGNQGQLQQLLDILLDNAQKYGTPGGTITVTLSRQNGHHCLLKVSNPGEAMTKDELKNLFKRFYRVDQARSMNHSYGLGLSIAQSITEAHKGKIWAEYADGVVTFCVRIPTK